jgi:Flp pilus assembly protein TadG
VENPHLTLPVRNPRERGIIIFIAGIMMFLTVGTVGLAVDGGLAFLVKARLMASVDSAALGAARGLNLGTDEDSARAAATSTATRFFNANFPASYMGTNPALTTITPVFTLLTTSGVPNGVLQVDVTGAVTAPTYFMRIFNIPSVRVSATGTATRRTLVMMMILDVSGSMQSRSSTGSIPTNITSSSSSCDAMVYAASTFLDYFSSYDYVGLITFSNSARVVYSPSNNFKRTDSSGANHVLKDLNCGGSTNTAPSINLAWDAIRNVGLRLAMNEILLFTDGMPNVVTGNLPLRTEKDTRYGPHVAYGTSPPPNDDRLLHSDPRDPFTWIPSNPIAFPADQAGTHPNNPNSYTAAQRAQVAAGVTPRFGDSRFLPLTNVQYSAYTSANSSRRNAYGWHLAAAAGPYRKRWIFDEDAPANNYTRCRTSNRDIDVANEGVTYMCYNAALPSLNTTPATAYGGIRESENYHALYGDKQNTLFTPVFGETVGTFPSGFPNSSNGAALMAQTIAYIPDTDAKGNSNLGFRDNWVYNVNSGCAPAGTITPGNDLCKQRGGPWTSYPSVGLGTNFFENGPYQGKLRPDLPNAFPVAAMNSAVSAANRVKDDLDYNIRFDSVYLIGNENFVDREFLQIIANVEYIKPTIFDSGWSGTTPVAQYLNTRYNPAHQKGLWYFTTNGAELASLFAQIASSLLRLSN